MIDLILYYDNYILRERMLLRNVFCYSNFLCDKNLTHESIVVKSYSENPEDVMSRSVTSAS